MDPETIKEARRILKELVHRGMASLKSGRQLQVEDEQLITLLEKVAAKKVEEKEVVPEVDDFTLKGTHHVRESNVRETPGQGIREAGDTTP